MIIIICYIYQVREEIQKTNNIVSYVFPDVKKSTVLKP